MARVLTIRLRLGLILVTIIGPGVDAQVPIGLVPPFAGSTVNRAVVPFVTVRAIEQDKKGVRYYTQGRGEASAGECTVELDARKKDQIIGLRQRPFAEVLDGLANSNGNVTVYVHGYNVTFDQACRDAASLQHLVGLDGRLLLFGWPANGNVASYLKDVGDLAWSVVPLQNLLVSLVERFGARRVDVIGHSLGAKAVVDAVGAVSHERGAAAVFGRLILIAPDVDADIFRRDFADFGDFASAVTVYVSAEDRALKASRRVSSEPRLGEGNLDLSGLDAIDVVDVVQRRWTFKTGHQYYLQNDAVADDLREVLSGAPHTSGSREVNGR